MKKVVALLLVLTCAAQAQIISFPPVDSLITENATGGYGISQVYSADMAADQGKCLGLDNIVDNLYVLNVYTCSGGGGGSPGGANGSIQYRVNSTTFGGISGVSSNGTAMTFAAGDMLVSGAQAFNLNSAALPTALSGSILRLGQADTTNGRLELDTFGSNGAFTCMRENGTNASPTTLVSGNILCSYSSYGYDGTAISSASSAHIQMFAGGTWSNTSHPSYVQIATTPSGSVNNAAVIQFENDGGITVPPTVTGGDKGAGTINATALYQAGGAVAALASPSFTGTPSASSFAITGTGGLGFTSYVPESSAPTAPGSGFSFYADSAGRFSWIRASDGFTRTWDATLTANRVYGLPDTSDTVAVLSFAQTLSNKTLASPTFTGTMTLPDSTTWGTGGLSALTVTALAGSGTTCVQASNTGVLSATGAACGSGSGAVNSVTNSDGTLTISPTTGAVVASLALGHANTWTAAQTFTNSDIALLGSSTGATTFTSANAGATNYTLTVPANTGTLAELNLAQTWTAVQTFTNSDIRLLGSSTGYTTFTSANAGASNYTLTFPAATDTLAALAQANAFTGNESHSGTEVYTSTSLASQAAGQLQLAGLATAPSLTTTGGQGLAFITAAGGLNLQGFGSTADLQLLNKSGTAVFTIASGSGTGNFTGSLQIGSANSFAWNGRTSLTSPATNSFQIGAADTASPSAQTLRPQSVSAGTSNTAGVNFTIDGSTSTGSGVAGDIIVQTGGTGAGATSQNSYVAALTLKGATQLIVLNKTYTVGTLPTGVAGAITFVTDQLTTCPATGVAPTGGGAVMCPVFYSSTASAWVGL
jgi:hypothetical protein